VAGPPIAAVDDSSNAQPQRPAEENTQSKGFTTYSMTLVGSFSLHGKTKTVRIPATVTYLPASEKTKAKSGGKKAGNPCNPCGGKGKSSS
jgi:hypothetical protein